MLLNCGVGEDSWESLDSKDIQPVHPKGKQCLMFIGRTDVEAETPILWPPDVKNWLICKDSDAGKDWRWDEKRAREDEMVGWHHRLNRHEFEQAPGDGEEQGSLAGYSPWGHKESDVTEWLNWTVSVKTSHKTDWISRAEETDSTLAKNCQEFMATFKLPQTLCPIAYSNLCHVPWVF